MIRCIVFVGVYLIVTLVHAQNAVDVMRGRAVSGTDTLARPVKIGPRYPGGPEALMDYVAYRIKYPKTFQRKGFNTGPLTVKFLIQTDGRVGDVQVTSRPTPPEWADEMSNYVTQIRKVFLRMPRWEPARLNGVPINYSYSLPFQVEAN
ncbi:MAG: hypothetical protein EAZ91_15815 [Cytophagales bacterium]|nr:MAG: hypothetical protein EAZ91_15815 [Cytophagales bacterium]